MGVVRLFLIEAEYVQGLLEAELDWVRRLVKEIEGGQLEGLDEWRRWHAPGRKRNTPKKAASRAKARRGKR